MKRYLLAALALVFVVSPAAAQATVPGEGTQTPATDRPGVSLTGHISNDGTILVAGDNNRWTVSNTSVLKGYEGRYVTVKCDMDPKEQSIRVLRVIEPDKTQSKSLKDSAFRR